MPVQLLQTDDLPGRQEELLKAVVALGKPVVLIGFGLSYSSFSFANLKVSAPQVKVRQTVEVTAEVTNTSAITGDEVVQLSIHQKDGSDARPMRP